jgi:hypothetical protein
MDSLVPESAARADPAVAIERVALRRLLWVGPLAVAAATIANEVARRIVVAAVPGVAPTTSRWTRAWSR